MALPPTPPPSAVHDAEPTTPPLGVYVADTGSARGRGVFAARAFAAGELVESAPVVLCNGRFEALPAELRALLFDWAHLAGARSGHALALGYGSLYNHDNPANLRYEAESQRHRLRFVAARDIAVGEELTINYNAAGGGHASAQDNWFERHGVAIAPRD